MKKILSLLLLLLCVYPMQAQEEIIGDIYNIPDTTAETIYQYSQNHDIEDIDGKTVVLWHPYVLLGASYGDKYLGVVPITLFGQAQDLILKNGEIYNNGKVLLYVPVGQGVYELTEQKADVIKTKLKVDSFVLSPPRNEYAWKKDTFKISAREEWILGTHNVYVTFHCTSYPTRYKLDFTKE